MILNNSLYGYMNNTNEKYIKALVSHFGSEEVGYLLFYLPVKYLVYMEGLVDEDYQDKIAIIFGKILNIYRKKDSIVLWTVDIKHPQQQKFYVYFKYRSKTSMKIGENYYFIGKISKKDKDIYMFCPKYQASPFKGQIHPMYGKIIGCPQEKLIEILKLVLTATKPFYPFITCENKLNQYSLTKILAMIHNIFHSNDVHQIKTGWYLLKLCEYTCFFHGVYAIQNRNKGDAKLLKYKFNLPLELTPCQKTTLKALSAQLELPKPTIGFLQGDVGSGKTLVAFCAINKTLVNGFNSCFMSPTVILNHQHYNNYKKNFPEFRTFLIQSGYKSKKYLQELKDILSDKIPTVFFGTHGILFEKLENIGFIVIDEQHKFGMEQRKVLTDNYPSSDVLFLSATPIPRTLFMLKTQQIQLYTLKTLPFSKNIKTILVKKKEDILKKIFELSKKEKILWINPAINPLDNTSLKSGVMNTYEFFKSKNLEVQLIHGKLKESLKLEILNNFKKGILVATTCVETGMDIEGLNTIVIEDAAQFGLATIHQLRGRVGRRGDAAQCILISPEDNERLEVLLQYNDGFKIAEMDLQKRGFGSFFQKQQWGLNNFKSGKFNEKLFETSGKICIQKTYDQDIISPLSKYFFTLQDVSY